MDLVTTEQLADAWRQPPPGETAEGREARMRAAARKARRAGVDPVPGRTDSGQRLWPAEALAVVARQDRRGNRIGGTERAAAARRGWETRRSRGT